MVLLLPLPPPPAEGGCLLVPFPPPWEDCLPLPPPPAEGECLLVTPPPPGAEQQELPLPLPPPLPGAEQQELPLPFPPPPAEAEVEYLLVPSPSPWEDCLPLPPPPAEGEYLLVPPPPPWEELLLPCLAPPKEACGSASPVEPPVTGYEGEGELLPPSWPGATLPSSPPESPASPGVATSCHGAGNTVVGAPRRGAAGHEEGGGRSGDHP
ncbi:UNVERIFIED_CONTAM: hypothetical protein FKN15_020475 [Acipenser sinensis]